MVADGTVTVVVVVGHKVMMVTFEVADGTVTGMVVVVEAVGSRISDVKPQDGYCFLRVGVTVVTDGMVMVVPGCEVARVMGCEVTRVMGCEVVAVVFEVTDSRRSGLNFHARYRGFELIPK